MPKIFRDLLGGFDVPAVGGLPTGALVAITGPVVEVGVVVGCA